MRKPQPLPNKDGFYTYDQMSEYYLKCISLEYKLQKSQAMITTLWWAFMAISFLSFISIVAMFFFTINPIS